MAEKITTSNVDKLPTKNELPEGETSDKELEDPTDTFDPEAVETKPVPTPTDNRPDAPADVLKLLEEIKTELADVKKRNADLESRVSASGTFESKITPKEREVHKGKKQAMKEQLMAQPKMSVFIPTEGEEKPGEAQLPVTLNGYRMNVPKGVYVEVPKQVGEVVIESLNQTAKALESKYRLDRSGDNLAKMEALS